jgi:argonaute-like protein implicated in RNA metabolism and viral defense
MPSRLVLHKSSNFSDEEIDGFIEAIDKLGIPTINFITIMESDFRLYRNGKYPPFRGSCLEINDKTNILYTRGSIEFYKTYPGNYVPQPIEVRLYETDESASQICEEILSLTKLNWNNTQLDGKYPITLASARAVGKILKYLPENENVQSRYSYYM